MRKQLAGLFLLGAGAAFAFPNPDGPCSITTAAALPQAVRGQAITYNIATSGCGTLRRAAVGDEDTADGGDDALQSIAGDGLDRDRAEQRGRRAVEAKPRHLLHRDEQVGADEDQQPQLG